jgi:thiol-disulfide isomerase/thioredoxin
LALDLPNKKNMKKFYFLFLLSFVIGCKPTPQQPLDFSGTWHAYLDISPDRIPFGLILEKREDKLIAILQNDTELLEFEEVSVEGEKLKIVLDTFDAEINASLNEKGELIGTFHRNYQSEYKLDLVAERKSQSRFPVSVPSSIELTGKWETSFTRKDGSTYEAVGLFRQEGDKLFGTFITSTGDYRFLEGNVSENKFWLSAFDGGHAFFFSGSLDESGKISGKFRSGPNYTEQLEAVRNENFSLPDANSLTLLKPGFEKFEFSFPNPDGQIVSLHDARFENKIVLIQVFGTWCINCLDETKFLIPWHQKNKDSGVEIVGLAFEAKSDFDYSAGRVRKYQDRLSVPYPLLIAGEFDKEKAAKALPALESLIAFPTLIYLDKNHRVRRINTGFTGPGTGPNYMRWIEEHELMIQKLLEE